MPELSTAPCARYGMRRSIGVVASPVMMDGARVAPGAPPPPLGADNAEIWGALGLDPAARAELHEKGVI